MPVELRDLTLAELEQLGLGEYFNEALQDTLVNIDDPNRDDKAREITIKLKITPTGDRRVADLSYTVSTKLRARDARHASLALSGGEAQISVDPDRTRDPRQGRLLSMPGNREGDTN